MNCLSTLVDLSLCGTETSLIRIRDIPFFNVKNLDHLAPQEVDNWKNVLAAITNNASARLESDMLAAMGVIRVKEGSELCVGQISGLTEIDLYTGRNGVNLELKPSTYIQMVITEVVMYSAIDGQDVTLFVEIDGIPIYTQLHTLNFGENIIPIELTIPGDRRLRQIFVGYNQDAEMFVVNNRKCDNVCHDCGCNCCSDTLNSGNEFTGGIQVVGFVECSLNQLICKSAGKLRSLLINALAVEYILYSMGTDRINKYTTTTTEKKDPMMVQYEIYEQRYQQGLTKVAKSINICDDCCFSCKEPIRSIYVCP